MQSLNDTPIPAPQWRLYRTRDQRTDDVACWLVELDRLPADPGLLSASERQRLAGILDRGQRQRALSCRWALRWLLGRYLGQDGAGLRLTLGAHGKPCMEAESLRFNLSHSGPLALIAISPVAEVGIDLEPIRPRERLEAIASRVLGADVAGEIGALTDPSTRQRCFTRHWTAFEARQKMTGHGLFGDRALPPHQLHFFEPAPNWLAALALSSPQPMELRFFRFEGPDGDDG